MVIDLIKYFFSLNSYNTSSLNRFNFFMDYYKEKPPLKIVFYLYNKFLYHVITHHIVISGS
jgi:hypothetical protein